MNNKGRSDLPQSSQAKRKEIMSVELFGDVQSKAIKSGFNNQEPKFPPKQYSFKDDQVVTIFHLLHKGNKMKLPDVRRPNEIGRTNDPKYCLYHRMVHHPTDKCYVLKDRIQALIDAGVLTLKTEQKKVTANMVTLEFGSTQKVTVPDGTYPAPAPRLEVRHPPAVTRDDKGLVPLTLETGEVMWIHPDLVQNVQRSSKESNSKGKSCNVISVLPDDGNLTSASLSDSEGEKHACIAQADAPQQTGTRSGKSYLRQYEKPTDETQQQTTSVPIPASTPIPTKGREKPKEVWFDHVLKKPSGQGFDTPFRFDILAHLVNILARITIHELLRLSKETREALRDVLANSETFLTCIPEVSNHNVQSSCPECHHVQSRVPAITFTAEDMLLQDNKHDRPLYYTRYIGSSCIERVQVDPGSALSIIPKRLLYFLGISLYRLCATTSTIYMISTPGAIIHLGRFDSVT